MRAPEPAPISLQAEDPARLEKVFAQWGDDNKGKITYAQFREMIPEFGIVGACPRRCR